MRKSRPRIPEGNTSRYDPVRVETLWVELFQAASRGTLPASDVYPGFTRLPKEIAPGFTRQPKEIKRIRCALYDNQLGLGLQLRWNLALEALRDKAIKSDPHACSDSKDELERVLKIAADFQQLGSLSGERPVKRALGFHKRSASAEWLNALCDRLNAIYGEAYRKVNARHKMTIKLFQTPYFSEEAVEEFNNLLLTGEPSRYSRVNRTLINETKQYYPATDRDKTQETLVSRLMQKNACRPIQCVVSEGAPTAVEAFAVHLGQTLPAALAKKHAGVEPPRRDVFLVPCGRWIKPSAFRGVDYFVHNLLRMMEGEEPSETVPDMSETKLQGERERLRELLGQRPVIFIFVGHDAVSKSLEHLQEAIIDAPLSELLSHLSRPTLGTREQPYDPRHFEWTYFVVVGTSDLDALREFKQPTLELQSIDIQMYPHVLEEGGFRHKEEIFDAMKFLREPATEAAICLFEQIRRIEQTTLERGGLTARSQFSTLIRYRGLRALTDRLLERLAIPGWELARALVLLTAFAIGGIKRATLLRGLILWNAILPDEGLDLKPKTTSEWKKIFDDWLESFASLLRSGPDEPWGEIDPQQHPFEYPGAITFILASGAEEWWAESIDFLIMEVRTEIVAIVRRQKPALAEQIHRILAEEALRQHTMVLRHTAPGDRLTMRSHRRGLQALYHGLESLPRDFDRQSADPEIVPDANVNAVLPAKHLVRFRYLYCGLLPRLFVDGSIERLGAAWGAERVKLEVSAYADDLLFSRYASEPERQATLLGHFSPGVFERHYDNLAVAAVRAGPNGNWHEIRRRLDAFCSRHTIAGAEEYSIALRDTAVLQMNLVEYGPEKEVTGTRLDELAERLEVDITQFDHDHWLGPGGEQTGCPTITSVNRFVARQVAKLGELPRHKRSGAATLFFFSGMMRADSAESHVSDVSRSAESLFHKVNQLLKSYAALMVAREVMWDGYGADNFPLPFLAAEGMRSICRVGLEIVRVLQKREHRIHFDGKKEADVLAMEITSTVRNCLDEYTRVFYTDASERAQMLILESRFARLAYYNRDSWATTAHSESVLVEPNASETSTTLNAMRYELAFNFLNEAEVCVANSITSDAVRLRFLSERCSSLRYLSESLSRVERKSQNDRTSDLERARALCRLALLDVRQLRNLIDRLTESKSILLTHAREARWSSLVDYHDSKLRTLNDQLAFIR